MLCKMKFSSFIHYPPLPYWNPSSQQVPLSLSCFHIVAMVCVCVCVPLNIIRVAAYISTGVLFPGPCIISGNTNEENDSSHQPSTVCQLSLKKRCDLLSHSILMMRH